MKNPQSTGLFHLRKSTYYSMQGLKAAWRNEAAFRQEIVLFSGLIPAAFWLGQNALEWILLIGSCLWVLSMELMNSAIEAAIDRISDEHHELSGLAKDLGSAAVFVSLSVTSITWGLIAWQRLAG